MSDETTAARAAETPALRPDAGLTLIEVLIALTLLIVAVFGLAQLFAYSARAAQQGRALTAVSVLASQKLDQLRGLVFAYDAAGVRVTDTTTDTTTVPESPVGGTGLTPSGVASLDTNTPGYCDFLDATGRVLGGGSTPANEATFVRRWRIEPLTSDPQDSLWIHVRVLSRFAADRGAADPVAVTFSTLRTRVMW